MYLNIISLIHTHSSVPVSRRLVLRARVSLVLVLAPERVLANEDEQDHDAHHDGGHAQVGQRAANLLLQVGEAGGRGHVLRERQRIVEKSWGADAGATVLFLKVAQDRNRSIDLGATWQVVVRILAVSFSIVGWILAPRSFLSLEGFIASHEIAVESLSRTISGLMS